ncbi:SusD/RagB family nutrient-binding outer membrane lipoprotein [Flavihumibacter sediminis]|nr:SusD/RagB family nutrient-binding outer membrane lipoprotein [Flavihumibacter sediminis]
MRSFSSIYITYIICIILTMTSCRKQFDININPSVVTNPPINTVMPNVTVNLAFAGGNELLRFPGLWVQQYAAQGNAGNQLRLVENYIVQGSDLISVWATLYANLLIDNEYILSNSADHPYYNGIARIINAWTFQHIVDMWGDVPFTEALNLSAIPNPSFDDDALIYPALVILLDEGIAQLSKEPTGMIPGNDDLIYNGNRQKWIRLANTLKMRIAIHYSEIDPGYTKSVINALVDAGAPVIDDNDYNFQMPFVDAPNAQNPIHQFEFRRPNQLFPNAFLVDMMNERSDPRRAFYLTPYPYLSEPATFKGAAPGDAQAFNYSRFHTYLRGSLKNNPASLPDGSLSPLAAQYTGTAPIRLLTAAEYFFIRAEASLRFGATGDAEELFRTAIRKSMEEVGVDEASIGEYLAAHGDLIGTPEEQLEQIIGEKYIALYGVALEPYTDWRRTGYPLIEKVPNGVLASIPTIFLYSSHELSGNPKAKQKASLLETVFWDQ